MQPQVQQQLETNISFTGDNLKSRIISLNGKEFVVKPSGLDIARAHHTILSDLGLVDTNLGGIEELHVKIFTDGCPPIIVRAQARPKAKEYMSLEESLSDERYVVDRNRFLNDYVKRFGARLVIASLHGVNVEDIIYNSRNMFLLKGELNIKTTTLLDVDSYGLPQYPVFLLDDVGIDKNDVAKIVMEHVNSKTYLRYKDIKTEAFPDGSEMHKAYKRNYNRIEKDVRKAGKDPEALDLVGSIKEMRSCVFTGIKNLDCDPKRGYHVTRIVNPQLQTKKARKRCTQFTKEVLKDCNEEGCRAAVGL